MVLKVILNLFAVLSNANTNRLCCYCTKNHRFSQSGRFLSSTKLESTSSKSNTNERIFHRITPDKIASDIVQDDNLDKLDALPEKFASFGKSIPKFRRGDKVTAEITGFGPLGASVSIVDESKKGLTKKLFPVATGLILNHEVEFWSVLNGRDPLIGDRMSAFVQNVRDSGKLDIALRPLGRIDY